MKVIDRLMVNDSEVLLHATGVAYHDSHNTTEWLAMDSAMESAMDALNGRFFRVGLHNKWRIVAASTCVIPLPHKYEHIENASPSYMATVVGVARMPKKTLKQLSSKPCKGNHL
jgi:hypothetical protein